MPQLSKNPIHKDVYYDIRDDLLWIFSALRSEADVKLFYYDFFTKTERVMFAKRLAIALMLEQGHRYDDIKRVLHVSTSTIVRMTMLLDRGGIGVKRAVAKISRQERAIKFLEKVDRFIDRHLVNPWKLP